MNFLSEKKLWNGEDTCDQPYENDLKSPMISKKHSNFRGLDLPPVEFVKGLCETSRSR